MADEVVQHGLYGIDHIGGGAAGVGLEGEGGVGLHPIRHPGCAIVVRCARQQTGEQLREAHRGGIGQRVVVGDARLRQTHAFQRGGVVPQRQHRGKVAHQRAIAAIALVRRAAQAAVGKVALQAAAAGVATIHRLAAQPADEGVGNRARRRRHVLVAGEARAAHLQQRIAQRQAHRRVVGHLSARQPEPAAADDVAMLAILRPDFARPHEFDRGAQCVADGQPEVGAEGAVVQRVEVVSHMRFRERIHWQLACAG